MHRLIAFDTETGRISAGLLTPPLVCLSWANILGEICLLDSNDAIQWSRKVISDPGIVLIGHNVSYDLAVLVEASNDPELLSSVFHAIRDGRISDTMLRESLLLLAEGRLAFDPEEGRQPHVSLAATVERRLYEEMDGKIGADAWRLRYDELIDVPLGMWPEDAIEYSKKDASATIRVWNKQWSLGESDDYLDPEYTHLIVDERRKIMAAWALHLCSCNGMRTDPKRVQEVTDRVLRAADDLDKLLLDEKLARTVVRKGKPTIVRTTRAVQDRVAKAYRKKYRERHNVPLEPYPLPAVRQGNQKQGGGGVSYITPGGRHIVPLTPPSKTFPEGQVSTSRNTLMESEDPVLVQLAELGEIQKLRTTYVPILASGTEVPIQPRYRLPMATGRTSCSHPNIQNLPTFGGIRECFIARPGYAILYADLDQAECVAWAQRCLDVFRYSAMAEALKDGKDPHLYLAIHFPQLRGVSYEAALRRKEAGDPLVRKLRKLSKVGNFGRMGGMGASTLLEYARSYGMEITPEEAEEVISAFDEAWPESAHAAEFISLATSGDSTFTFVQRISYRRRGGCGYTDGRNQAFQGGIADLALDVLFRLALECHTGEWSVTKDTSERKEGTSPLYGARLWAFEHDAFLLEVPYDSWGRKLATEAAERLEQIVSLEAGRFWFPDVPIRTTAAYARRWIKDRKTGREIHPVHDENGYLIPCDEGE